MIASPINGPMSESLLGIVESLPNPGIEGDACPRRTKVELDLILLAIEAIESSSSEQILELAKELNLQEIIKNRIVLWRMRSTNPMRRAHTRRILTLKEAKALSAIGCRLASRLAVPIRQLMQAQQQLSEKQIPPEYNFRMSEYLDRFRAHFRSRMNPRRAKVSIYQDDDKLNELAVSLLSKLLFCTGTLGTQRLWMSLFDGEVK
ncbi:DUF3038 domain-containing protein [Chamaesiphon sp. OTE_75_metabat_556]|jgi:Protein of unknown function (DUF3038)|uniref:DUF3038 domain-containing protein n=2 Tax=unclassified Chamaesiphon TaxID=2620921 RepID=UPI00286CDB5B|nr:DUF3038 domain-containing protein [Chamaesiphon sp. OTE_75_metabat_556]